MRINVCRVVGVDVKDAKLVAVVRPGRREAPRSLVLLLRDPDEDERSVDLAQQPAHRLGEGRRDEDVSFVVREARCPVASDAREAVRTGPQPFARKKAAAFAIALCTRFTESLHSFARRFRSAGSRGSSCRPSDSAKHHGASVKEAKTATFHRSRRPSAASIR